MASTWGNSWGTSWGVSWNIASVVPTPSTSSGGGGRRARRRGEKVVWYDDWVKSQKEIAEFKAKPKKQRRAIAKEAIKVIKASNSDLAPVIDAQEFIFDNAKAVKELQNLQIVLEAYFMLKFMQQQEEDVAALIMLGVL